MTEGDDTRREPDRASAGTGTRPILLVGLVVLAALLVLLVLAPGRDGSQDGRRHPAVGTRLPALELEPLVNTQTPLTLSDVAGQVVLINYWGPWCPGCNMEMPHLMELEKAYRGRDDFRFVSVSCGIGTVYANLDELRADTARFVQNHGVEFAVYSDPEGTSRWALIDATELGGMPYPATLLCDGQANIRALWLGYRPGMETEVAASVEQTLNGR